MNKVRVFKMLMLLFVLTSIIGTICRIQHWPFGKELCIAGCIGLGIFSVLYFSSKSDKSILDKLALIGFPLLSISLFFRSNRLPFQFEVFLVFAFIILVSIIYLLVQSFRNDKSKSSIKLNWQRFVLIAIFLFVGLKVLSKTC